MATAMLVLIDEYLHTGYERDVEYVDGELKERPVVFSVHGLLQGLLAQWFLNRAEEWDIKAAVEVRTRVSANRVRLPDVVVGARRRWPETLIEPPLLVIEILSPSDTFGHIEEVIADYQAMGIPGIWLIQPSKRSGWMCDTEPWVPATMLRVKNSPVYVDLEALFAALDESNRD